ncbi:hypothetical protein OXX69_009209 [Metschnikowia pulcherrima]
MRDRIQQLEAEVADSNRLLNGLGNIQHSQLELSHQQPLGRFSQLQEELSAHQQTTDRAVHANAQEAVDSVTTNTLKYFNKPLHAYHQDFAHSLADATARSGQRIDDSPARIQYQQVSDSAQLRDRLRQAFIGDAQDAHNLAIDDRTHAAATLENCRQDLSSSLNTFGRHASNFAEENRVT